MPVPEDPSTGMPTTTQAESLSQQLAFARKMAQEEIEAVDRLHKRTLLSLTIPLTAFGLLFTSVGWIGYSNLKRVAVQTTTDVVTKQLQDELTKKNIDSAVQRVLREHATEQINDSVREQIHTAVAAQIARENPALRSMAFAMASRAVVGIQPQIQEFAKLQAQALIGASNQPRTFTEASSSALTSCVRKAGPQSLVVGVGGDPEAQGYEAHLTEAIERGGWNTIETAMLSTRIDIPRFGLIVFVQSSKQMERPEITSLMPCLREAKIPFQLVTNPKSMEWGNFPGLLVLPKPR